MKNLCGARGMGGLCETKQQGDFNPSSGAEKKMEAVQEANFPGTSTILSSEAPVLAYQLQHALA